MEDINILLNKLNEENISEILKSIKEVEETGNKSDIKKFIMLLEIDQTPPHVNHELIKKVKLSAIKALGILKEKEALGILIKTLNAGNTRMKNAVSEALGKIGDEIAVEPLIETLKDETSKVSAIKALGEIGGVKALDHLLNMLKDKDPEARSTAATSLGQIKNMRALEALTKALEEDTDVNVRRLASIAIGEIGHDSSVPVLIKKLNDKFLNVATSSADSLIKIGNVSVKPLVEVIENKLAADALIKIGEPSVDELINALTHENENIRAIAAKCLGKIKSPKAVKFLVKELKNNRDKTLKIMRDSIFFICSSSLLPLAEELNRADETTQDLVVDIFFDIGNLTDNGLERLRNELNTDNPVFQKLIIRTLGKLNDSEVIPLLNKIFLSTPCLDVKKEILKTINKIGPREDMVTLFQKALEDEDKEIKKLAVQSIINSESSLVSSIMIKLLKEGDENLKRIIVNGLGMTNNRTAITPLLEVLKTDDNTLKLMGIEALGNKQGEMVTTALIDLLQDPSSKIQLAAIRALKKLGDKTAIPDLKLLRKNSLPEIRQEVETVLEELEGPKSFWAKLLGM